MPTADGLPVRPAPRKRLILTAALAAYAVSSLISMAAMSIGAAFAAAAILYASGGPRALGSQLRRYCAQPWLKRYLLASAALVGACLLSSAVARFAPVGWNGKYVKPEWGDLAKSWYFAWPLFLVAGLRQLDGPGRRTVLRSWLIALGALSAIGIIQYFTGWPREQRIPSSPDRFHATIFLGHHLSVASILIFPFFAALDFLKKGVSGKRLLPPLGLGAILLLAFAALVLSYSRTLWIALPLGLILWAARGLSRRQAGIASIAAVLGLLAASQVPAVQSRLHNMMGVTERQKLWQANLEFLRLRPLTGTGFRRNIEASAYYLESLPNDGYIFISHAHNNFIDMLGGTGILGALAWLGWFWVVYSILWRGFKKPGPESFAWGLLCAWVVFQINGLTQVNFWEGKVMHQMMWVVAWSFFWFAPEIA